MALDAPGSSVGAATEVTSQRLQGSLGVSAIVFMVVAAAAPLTVIAGTVPIGIAFGNGAGYPLTYAVCCAILLFFAVGFTTMSRHISNAGGFYSYIEHGLGRSAGLGAAFLAVLTYVAVLVAVYGYLGAAIGDLLGSHFSVLPWWAWSALVIAAVGVLGYRQIDLSSKVLGVLLVAEVAVVLIIDAFVVAKGGGSEGFSTAVFHPDAMFSGAPGIAVMFAMAGFLGFEATVVFRDEARNPERTIPRATYTALLVIGTFYAVSSWAIVSAWGDRGAVERAAADPGGMVAETAQRYVGTAAADLVTALLVTSLIAAALSFHNVTARYLFSLGSTRVLPRQCGRVHPRHGSPHVASVVVSASAAALLALAAVLGLDPVAQVFAWLAGIATVGVVALMLFTSLAVIVFFRVSNLENGAWPTRIAPGIAFTALAGCFYITVTNMPLLVGGSTRLAIGIGAVMLGAVLAGPVLAALRPASAHAFDTSTL